MADFVGHFYLETAGFGQRILVFGHFLWSEDDEKFQIHSFCNIWIGLKFDVSSKPEIQSQEDIEWSFSTLTMYILYCSVLESAVALSM